MRKRVTIVKELLEEHGPSKVFNMAREVARDHVYKLRNQGKISFSDPKKGDVPTLHVVRRTLPEVWEDTTMALMGVGQEVHTHYDPGHEKKEYESFPSLEATTMMHIEEPFAEPRFHMHFLSHQFGDYKAEMEGVKDHWVLDPSIVAKMIKKKQFNKIKDHKGWLYSYSQRVREYPCIDVEGNSKTINQLQSVITNLVKNPLSRSAQCTVWDPRFDQNDGQFAEGKFNDYHAPCLQRIHFRLIPFEDGFQMNATTHWRSRCHLKAVPHNIYGMLEGVLEPQRKDLQNHLGVPVKFGRYVDISDTLHVYGHYLDQRMQGLDAEAYLEDIFRVSRGDPIEDRLVLPGTPIYDMTLETIDEEYKKRIQNPNYGKSN